MDEKLTSAVVLAGGLGTRLGTLTADLPKPLAPASGRPFLEHQLRLLRRHGVEDVLLLTGYLGEQIEAAFGGGGGLGLRLTYSREPEPLGTGGALRRALPQLPPTFFLVNGDTYLDCQYQRAASRFAVLRPSDQGPAALMVVAPSARTDSPGNVRLDESGERVESYRKDAGGDHDYIDAGVLVLNRSVVEWIADGQRSALEAEIFPRLASSGLLFALPTNATVYDIGTPERLTFFERSLQ